MTKIIDFQTDPSQYRHWRVAYDGNVAHLIMDVDEQGGLFEGYELKLNSYDLGVDIELADIIQRMRFEQPQIGAVVLKSGKERVFCAGANIRMLGGATHAHKVNFCKFTNETRNTMETAGRDSGQHYLAAVRGSCAGGGYELALACDKIYMTDDSTTSVALPEAPLLAVLPGTGGLTRVTDKRKVRRDRADVFCTIEEGIKGKRAKDWRLVDEVVANSKFDDFVDGKSREIAANARPGDEVREGIKLSPLNKQIHADGSISYTSVEVEIDRDNNWATLTIAGPDAAAPDSVAALHAQGDQSWILRTARELDDALLHLRFNELETGVLVIKTQGDPDLVATHEALVLDNADNNWLCNEISHYWKRVLKRLDMTSRSLVALVENGSCFSGVLAELLFAVDRSYMMEGDFEEDNRPVATIRLSQANFGPFPMSNDLTRLQTRFLNSDEELEAAEAAKGQLLEAFDAEESIRQL